MDMFTIIFKASSSENTSVNVDSTRRFRSKVTNSGNLRMVSTTSPSFYCIPIVVSNGVSSWHKSSPSWRSRAITSVVTFFPSNPNVKFIVRKPSSVRVTVERKLSETKGGWQMEFLSIDKSSGVRDYFSCAHVNNRLPQIMGGQKFLALFF